MKKEMKDSHSTTTSLLDPVASATAGPPLPEGWTPEDIHFLLGELENGPLLVADTTLGIPTIHSDFGAEVEHCGFGLMRVRTAAFTLHFDAGGAMARTPSGKGWTSLHIEGRYDYDSGAVREKLLSYLPEDRNERTDDHEDPERDTREREAREQASEFTRSLAQFYGTQAWHHFPAPCPHLILLTDGVRFVVEHGGQDGGTAGWLIEAIASFQGEPALQCQPFQVWTMMLLPKRSATLVCTDGNERVLAHLNIEVTDFLPVGELRLYASIEAQPELSSRRKTMILLLPSEY